jgi:hypothetical protein
MSAISASEVTNDELTHEFEQIFREHSQLVYRTAYGATGNAEDAEDVLQTIFLRLLRNELPPNLKNNPKASNLIACCRRGPEHRNVMRCLDRSEGVNELKHPEGVQGNQPGVKPRSGATPGIGSKALHPSRDARSCEIT